MPRLLTSLVGIPVLVAAIWWGPPWLTLLVTLAAVLGVREFYRLQTQPPPSPTRGQGGDRGRPDRLPLSLGALWAVALVLGGQAASDPSSLLLISLGIILGGAFLSLLWLIAFFNPPSPLFKREIPPGSPWLRGGWGDYLLAGLYLIGGPIYVGFPLAHALALRGLGRDWLLLALLVTFAADTGAFFTGRSIGRHRLAPSISPNKTWEGAAGGLILAMVVALALGQLLALRLSLWQQASIGATVGVVAQLGDLLESKLKRLSQAKDTGSIIPGHGGLLDRLDSIVLSVPAVYYLLAVVFKP